MTFVSRFITVFTNMEIVKSQRYRQGHLNLIDK